LPEIVRELLVRTLSKSNEIPVTGVLGYLRDLTSLDLSTGCMYRIYRTLDPEHDPWAVHHLSILLDCMPQLTSLDLCLSLSEDDLNQNHRWLNHIDYYQGLGARTLWKAISRLTSLRSLCVGTLGEKAHPEGLAMFAGALNNLTCLTELKLFETTNMVFASDFCGKVHKAKTMVPDAFDKRGEELFGTIGRLTDLRTLHIPAFGQMNQHSPAVAWSLVGALCGLKELVDLDLRCHTFCLEGASALANALKSLSGLTSLRMSTNQSDGYDNVNAEAVASLAAPLCSLTSLTLLETYNGPVDDETFQTLAVAISRMPALTCLDMTCFSGYGSDGATALANALRGLSGLTDLSIPGNKLGVIGWQYLRDTLLGMSSLEGLVIELDGIEELGETSARHLRDALLGMSSLKKFAICNATNVNPDVVDWGIAELGIDALPREILRSGWMPTLEYVRKISTQGGKRCGMLRLLIVGMAEVGKTCLRKAILSDNSVTEEIALDDRTIGIDTDMWRPCDDLDISVRNFFPCS
jgi:hypothetical protein